MLSDVHSTLPEDLPMLFDPEIIEHYKNMSDSEKIAALRKAIHMEERPLYILFALLTILEPDKVETILARLGS